MKLITLLLTMLIAFNVYSFDQITLLRDIKMNKKDNADLYYSKFEFKNGADRCVVILSADGISSSGLISKSTVFNDLFVEQNECYFDLLKTCKLGLSALSDENDANLSLTCWSKGLFVRALDEQKINQIISDMLLIK